MSFSQLTRLVFLMLISAQRSDGFVVLQKRFPAVTKMSMVDKDRDTTSQSPPSPSIGQSILNSIDAIHDKQIEWMEVNTTGTPALKPQLQWSQLNNPEELLELAKDIPTKFRDRVRETVQTLAELSLEDYKWRSSVFKRNEADRQMEQSLAIMQGKDPSYVRPMDANNLGPLVSLSYCGSSSVFQYCSENH